MFNRVKKLLRDKSGVTLLETLIALTLLVIMIFCFMPLFAQYLNGIKTAGRIKQETQYKVSIMERLVSYVYLGQGDNSYYQSDVDNVPVEFSYGGAQISFNSDESNRITGSFLSNNIQNGGANNYVTLHTDSASAHMVCFPSELTDDFISTEIVVVPKGKAFAFADRAQDKYASADGEHFKVFYTNSGGGLQAVDPIYYDIKYVPDGEKNVAVFTFYGGNNVICFENSPILIKYGSGNTDNLRYSATVEIGAPEIIMVGEKAENGKYYYYATAGVDENGRMDIIAKEMTSSPLTSAMNDVAWVEKGGGDDGNGGVNKYGYYVMGGDAGQVRRFWRNTETGNYYWGGDNLLNYDRYAYLKTNGTPESGAYENMTPALTTQAMFKTIFRGPQDIVTVNGRKVNELFKSEKVSLFKYQALISNYFSANVTESDYNKYYLTLSGAVKIKNLVGSKYEYYGPDSNSSEDESVKQISWLTGGQTKAANLNVNGYKYATDYEYPDDNSLITITSVGAIQINKSNSNYYESQDSNAFNQNIYPTQSYTLYCGYIPSVTDSWGWKTATIGWKRFVHTGTYGAVFDAAKDSWVPTGKFGDIHTTSKSLSASELNVLDYKSLLNYCDTNNANRDTLYPYPSKNNNTVYYTAGTTANGVTASGIALPAQGNDYYITGGDEVDITVGYLSHPFAISLNDPEVPTIAGLTGSDYYFEKFNGVSGKFDHGFFSGGLRDNVTMLDIKSFHDDITGNNISFAVGYALSYMLMDYSYMTRVNQVFNTGIVYIRATGDGTEKDDAGNLSSGKGWSLKKETNVFHQFYGTDQYLGNDEGGFLGLSKDGTWACYGWDTTYHRDYFNISSSDSKAPQASYSPNPVPGTSDFGTNCHPLAQTECNTVNKGVTWDEKTQVMWGTDNGTILSWTYDYEKPTSSKITSVTKEFESYIWADRIGTLLPLRENSNANQFFDYPSVSANKSSNYGFVSVLSSIEDVAYADGYWVAVGSQSGKDPANYCSVNSYSSSNGLLRGGAGSYINVKYDTGLDNFYAWKTVKVAEETNINFISVTYARGVWYAMGYIDKNGDGENDLDEEAVVFYSRDPENQWSRALTSEANGSSLSYSKNTTAIYFDTSNPNKPVVSTKLTGVNKMTSRD